MAIFKPRQFVARVSAIDFTALAAAGRRYFIFDVDNTLAANGTDRVDDDISDALCQARTKGEIAAIALVSNVIIPTRRRLARLAAIAASLGIPSHLIFAANFFTQKSF